MNQKKKTGISKQLRRPIGVRAKLLLSFILLILVTTAVFFSLTYFHERNLVKDHLIREVQQISMIFSEEVKAEISKTATSLEKFAAEPEIQSLDKQFLSTYFSGKHLREVSLDGLFIYDESGNPIYKAIYNDSAFTGDVPPLKEPPEKIFENRKYFVFPAGPCCTRPSAMFILVPIRKQDGTTGGAVVGVKAIDSSIVEHVIYNHHAAGKGVFFYLVSNSGRILSRQGIISGSRQMFGTTELRGPLAGAWDTNRIAIEDKKAIKFEFKSNGDRYIATAATVSKELGWHIILVQPASEAFSSIKTVTATILLFGLLALVAATYMALYRARRITKPISELLQAVEEISRGDYSKRVRIFRRDEFGSLAFSFNRMSSVLQEKIAALQDSQKQLEEAFNQLQSDTLKREEYNKELARKVSELTSLSEVTNAISNTLDLNALLETIADTVIRIIGFDSCSIKLFDKQTNTLRIRIAKGLPEEYVNKDDTPYGEGISGLAVKMCKPIVIADIETDTRVPMEHILRGMNIKSLISMPLITKQSVMGTLNLYAKIRHEFTEDEKQLLGIFAAQAAGAIENARLFDSLRDSYLNTIQALSMTIDAKDPYTHGHSKRVSDISVMIGREMGLSPEELERLKYAGDLHDIGKIGISESIISKRGKLTIDEYELIKTHPLVGETIIEPVPFLQDLKPIIRHHHERYDGYGYPDVLKGDAIPLLSRIIHLADAYDAMTSDRPYRKALTHELAVQEIVKHSGSQFDPEVVEAFLRIFDTNPEITESGKR